MIHSGLPFERNDTSSRLGHSQLYLRGWRTRLQTSEETRQKLPCYKSFLVYGLDFDDHVNTHSRKTMRHIFAVTHRTYDTVLSESDAN